MQGSVNRWLLCTSVCLLGICTGVVYYAVRAAGSAEEDPLVLEPSVLEIVDPALEGSDVKVSLMLRNTGEQPVQILAVKNSCGCLDLVTRGGKPLGTPLELDAGEAFPLQATIRTGKRGGSEGFGIGILYESGGKQSSCMSEIRLNVLPALRIVSGAQVFDAGEPGATITEEIGVGDAFPDPGIEVESVTNSRPERVRIRLVDCEDSTVYQQEQKEHLSDTAASAKQRYRIQVSYTAEEDGFHDTIAVHPRNEEHEVLYIPVFFRGRKATQSRLYPRRLVIRAASAGETLEREVRYVQQSDQELSRLVVLDSPEFVSTEIERNAGGVWRIDLKLTVPEETVEESSIVLGNEKRERVARIPVSFLRQDDQRQ